MNLKFNLGGVNLTANGFDKYLAHFTTATTEGKVVTTPDTDIPDEHRHDFNLVIDNMVIEMEDIDMKAEAEVYKDLLSFAGDIFKNCLEYKKLQDKADVEELKRLKLKHKDMEKEIKDLTRINEKLEERCRKVSLERDQLKFRQNE